MGNIPPAYDEDDGDAIVQETKARLSGIPVDPPAAYDEDDGDAIVLETKQQLGRGDTVAPLTPAATAEPSAEEKQPVEFAANPCRGPTARFLSTCR